MIRLFIPLLALCALPGCQTMQGWLKPLVCECAAPVQAGAASAALTCPTHEPTQHVLALTTSQDATQTALEHARAEAELVSDPAASEHVEAPQIRRLERETSGAKPGAIDPLELIDPTVAQARVAPGGPLPDGFNVSLAKDGSAAVFYGNFAKQPGEEVMLVQAGKEIAAYASNGRIARLAFSGEPAPQAFAQLGLEVDPSGVSAVQMVKDETLQLLVHWRARTDTGGYSYHVGLFKVIGPFIGQIYTAQLATSDTPDGPLKRQGTYEVLHGKNHRYIRWIPADESGRLLVDQAEVLKWNHWEGMFRVPRPPAAGPRRDKLQSQRRLNAPTGARYSILMRELTQEPGVGLYRSML